MDIDKLREAMGTNPKQSVKLETRFFEGVRGINVQLLDFPINPYLALFDMATSTWGNKIHKWGDVSPEARFWVVKSVLEYKSLPNAMESSSFTFAVEGCSRSAFDQIARARIGSVFSSMGWRDNDHSDIGFRVPQSIWDDADSKHNFETVCNLAKQEYHRLVSMGQASWQDARALLPISACHNFSMSMSYLALRNFMGKRLKFCEQSDTVAAAWLMREEMKRYFPMLGLYLRPGCDWKGICDYHQSNAMSEAFGCLFKECGRNKCLSSDQYATFNFACSDVARIEEQSELHIPRSGEDLPPQEYKDLDGTDRFLLEDDGA